jgi:GNAT superfamily N-acetyltransferase
MQYDSAVLESVSQRFRRDMWLSAAPAAIAESGIELQRFGPVQATAFGDLPAAVNLNQIQGAAEPGAIEEGHLTAAIEWMRSREVHPRVAVADCRPGASAADEWLGDRGYEQVDGWVKFVCDPRDSHPRAASVSSDLVVYELGGQEIDGEALSAIIAEGMELPAYAGTLFFSLPEMDNWRCYTAALAADQPVVATASMMIEGGVAQLGPGHTLPQARGRGCNTALLGRRLADAAEAGCHTAVVELWHCQPDHLSAAARNLCCAGFELAYPGHSWQRPALHPAVH